MHRFNGWKHLTWTVESNVDCCCCHPPTRMDTQQKRQFFHICCLSWYYTWTVPWLLQLQYFFCLYSLFICAKSIKWQDQSWYLGSPRPTATENVQYTNCELSHTCLTSILSASSSFFRSIFHNPIFLLWYLYLKLWKNDFLFVLVRTKNT